MFQTVFIMKSVNYVAQNLTDNYKGTLSYESGGQPQADLLTNVVVKTKTRDDTKSKYFQLLTTMCEKRQQPLVELLHVVLDKAPEIVSLCITALGIC